MNHRRRLSALRRYPALGFLAIAAVLATMLPTALHVPLSGPSTQAEVAAVPGKGQQQGAVSDLNGASSGGLGFGNGNGGSDGAGRDAAGDQRGQPKRSKAGVLPCVGKPPRQTEDPLSPPCIPFFDGSNGGATARGVSGSEITVVVYTSGANSTPQWTDWSVPADPADNAYDQVGRAFTAFLNSRYQFYNRTLHVWRFRSTALGGIPTPDIARNDVGRIDTDRKPFALVSMTDAGGDTISDEASRRGIITINHEGFPRALYQQRSPHLITWVPDLENQAEQIASFVCVKLRGRTARFSRQYPGSARKWGIFYEGSAQNPNADDLAFAVRDRVRNCDIDPVMTHAGSDSTQQAATEYTTALADLSTSNVTSVIVIAGGGAAGNLSNRAASSGYFPEWIVGGGGTDDAGPDRDSAAQLYNQAEWASAFGLSFEIRRNTLNQQPWYQAFVEGCPTCAAPPTESQASRLYESMSLVAYAIQAAGPRLTAANVDKGMHALPVRKSSDPYTPAAYFAPGNWSFIKDAVPIWWDGSSPPPGENRVGCYRLPNNGERFRAVDWSGDDSEFFSGQPPCQGLPYRSAS